MKWFFWAFSSAFFAGVTAFLAKIGVSGLNSNLATAIRTTVILVFSWAIVFVTTGGIDVQGISRKTWLFLVMLFYLYKCSDWAGLKDFLR